MQNENLSLNLDDRLIDLACMCLEVCDLLPNTKAGNNLECQISKGAITCALLYSDAKAAESKVDFIRRMKIALKEMLGLRIILRIVKQKPVVKNEKIDLVIVEASHLISVVTKSIEVAQGKRTIKGANK